MSRIAILAGPYRVDDQLGGIGLRLWELGQALADAGHQVVVVAPYASDFTHPGVRLTTDASEAVAQANAVLSTDLPDTGLLLAAHRQGKLLIAENAPPIEHLHFDALAGQRGPALYADTVARWRLQLLLADHLLVRSEAERTSTLGALVALGRMGRVHHRSDPGLGHLVSLVPIGFNRHSALAAAQARTDPNARCDVLWNGGVWDYCHPAPVLAALADAAAQGVALTLRLLYDPGPERSAELRQLADRYGVADQVLWPSGTVPHRQRDAWVKAARALVITGQVTAENLTCHRLRLRDAALYRLPVVLDAHGATGDLVSALRIGPVADPGDPAALAHALICASRDGEPRASYLSALDGARPRFVLERHLGPLLKLLDEDRPAPDRDSPDLRRAVESALAAHPALTEAPPAVI
ncbi:hypothetical protein ACEZDB_32460 [Streptacidiphilus sp. N1-3]|uniref:D-inositol 3-phosphate glycosyltransferase n=1 Tax=Streptacidiphilus alkalitolerans TaxID=3342712 RepID=A0ABV6XAT9_9ACTN